MTGKPLEIPGDPWNRFNILECLQSHRATKPYDPLGYNCEKWAYEAADACGLDCPKKPSKGWDPDQHSWWENWAHFVSDSPIN